MNETQWLLLPQALEDIERSLLLLALAVSGGVVLLSGALLFLVSGLSGTLTDRARLRIAGMGNLLTIVGTGVWLIGAALAIYHLWT